MWAVRRCVGGVVRPVARRFSASSPSLSDTRNSFIPFREYIEKRRCQAKKSIIVQVNSESSFSELNSYCAQFGNVVGIHHYALLNNQQHFMLVEFDTEQEANELMLSANYMDDVDVIPVMSPFVWFRMLDDKHTMNTSNAKKIRKQSNMRTSLVIQNGCHIPTEAQILSKLSNSEDVSEQILELYQTTKLNDLGERLRYITARQIENAFLSMFPNICVFPFGSSVNGFGNMGSDLDLVMKFSIDSVQNMDSRLVLHSKKSMANSRFQQQRCMEIISDMIQLFLPGCSNVRRILQARIPIIKYNQDYAGLECDLSMSSLSGLYMSELLYLFGSFDDRVRPLIFTIRRWAKFVSLTNPSPGKWITNFPLTLMVLFFLQNASDGPIIPTLNYLKKHAGKADIRTTDDFVNCTFARDIRRLSFKSHNDDALNMLLIEFFHFYSNFDFSLQAICINEGKVVYKPDSSPLYVINPLEVSLNVSKNVSFEECERLKLECRNAIWLVESSEKTSKSHWGIGSLLHKKKSSPNFMSLNKRLITVKELFVDDISEQSDLHKSNINLDKASFKEIENEDRIIELEKLDDPDKISFNYNSSRNSSNKFSKEILNELSGTKRLVSTGAKKKL